jgi:hypothetical protein
MKTRVLILFLAILPVSLQGNAWGWFNHGLAKLNIRSSHVAHSLDNNEDIEQCQASVEAGKILSLRNAWRLNRLLKDGNEEDDRYKHGFIRNILTRHHRNATSAAYEVKCTIFGIATGIILYRNRARLGKRWEHIKDSLAGATLVWGSYKLRHQITNIYTNALHLLRRPTA